MSLADDLRARIERARDELQATLDELRQDQRGRTNSNGGASARTPDFQPGDWVWDDENWEFGTLQGIGNLYPTADLQPDSRSLSSSTPLSALRRVYMKGAEIPEDVEAVRTRAGAIWVRNGDVWTDGQGRRATEDFLLQFYIPLVEWRDGDDHE
ncbi:MAG: hypothetical protein ACRDQA_30690 [Nocardioidaceae bacterium]